MVRIDGWGERVRFFLPHFGKSGQTKIEDFDQTVGAEHNVLGFDVAMKDARFVRGLERRRDLRDDRDSLRKGQPPAGQPLAQGDARDIFHGNVMNSLCLADFIDGDDVRMIVGGRGAGFTHEALQTFIILSVTRRQWINPTSIEHA